MQALLIVLVVISYIFMGGVYGRVLWLKYDQHQEWDVRGLITIFSSPVWPASVLILGGIWIGNVLANTESRKRNRLSRKDKEHQQKLELLKEQRLLNESALKLLDSEGIQARVVE